MSTVAPSLKTKSALEYSHLSCDLCHNEDARLVLEREESSITSDLQIVASPLRKLECANCGLVRSGFSVCEEVLDHHQRFGYQAAEQWGGIEKLYFTEKGAIPQSRSMFEWILANLRSVGCEEPHRILEMGCGVGNLLNHLRQHWTDSLINGVDISARSILKAQEKGLEVIQGSYTEIEENYQLIIAVDFLSQIPSPRNFFMRAAQHLNDGGLLVIVQPSLDRHSQDIFYSDFLHHFSSHQLAKLAQGAGLQEVAKSTRHPYITDRSLQVFRLNKSIAEKKQVDKNGTDFTIETVSFWERSFANVNSFINRLEPEEKFAVWGLGRTFKLLKAYTDLRDEHISLGIDDHIEPLRSSGLPYPLKISAEVNENELRKQSVLVAVRPPLGPMETSIQQLKAKGLTVYSPFDEHLD